MSIACSTSIRHRSSLEEALERVRALGFRHVDLLVIDGWVHVDTRDLSDRWDATIRRIDMGLEQYALVPIAANSGVGPQLHHRAPEINAQRVRETRALVRFMNHCGIGFAAIQPRAGDPDRPWTAVLRDCVASLRDQAAAARDGGVELGLELHVRSAFESLEQARRLFKAMPEVKVVYDPTHFVSQGIDLPETEWLIDHALHVHLRDAAPGQLQAPFGEGAVDFERVFAALKDRGYARHFSIEYFDTPDFDVGESVLRLRDAIARHFDP